LAVSSPLSNALHSHVSSAEFCETNSGLSALGAPTPPAMCRIALIPGGLRRLLPLETGLSWEGIRPDTQGILLMARFSGGLRAHGHLAQPSPSPARGEGFGRTRATGQVARSARRDFGRGRPRTVPPRPRLAGCRNHAPGEPRDLLHRLPGRPRAHVERREAIDPRERRLHRNRFLHDSAPFRSCARPPYRLAPLFLH